MVLQVAGMINVTVGVSLTVTGISTIGWFHEYRRHRKNRERLTARITMLEKRIDPNRSSSMLTTEGTTARGDR